MPIFKTQSTALLLAVFLLFSSSCATIVGGSQYNAYVKVDGKPNAKIYYHGRLLGTGAANLKIPRKGANALKFKVVQEGCPEQEINFTTRGFRGWALVGSLVTFSIITPVGIPIPVGNLVDFATGAYWKPEQSHPSIRKVDYNNYHYNLDYSLCKVQQPGFSPAVNQAQPLNAVQTKEDKLIELKELFDSGMITEEEYQSSRKAILAQ